MTLQNPREVVPLIKNLADALNGQIWLDADAIANPEYKQHVVASLDKLIINISTYSKEMNHAVYLSIISILTILLIIQRCQPNRVQINNRGVLGAQELWFYVDESSVKGSGRGVFTRRSFKKDEVVMSAPLLTFDEEEIQKDGTISRYCGHLREEKRNFLCFDYQGLCNTANKESMNNVRAVWRIAEDKSQYVALRDINIGEEILQAYGGALRKN